MYVYPQGQALNIQKKVIDNQKIFVFFTSISQGYD